MLGLGNTLVGGAPSPEFDPTQISGLQVWLKAGTGMTSNQDASGTGHTKSTAAGDIADTDRINSWADQSGNGNDATQTTGTDMPKWDSAAADAGAAHWDSSVRWLDLDSAISINANQDFTVIIRWKSYGLAGRSIIGNDSSNMIKIVNNTKFQVMLGGANNFDEGDGSVFVTTAYYTSVLTRSNGSTGTLKVNIDGGAFSDKDWDSGEGATDADATSLSNIGSGDDDQNEWRGHISDILVYVGTALTATDRDNIYTYIANQTQEQS